ncbi:MAG: carboxymuconolactone decarboxylase family protein [Chloroflexia bacterium]
MDINAAGGSKLGITHDKFEALGEHSGSRLFTPQEEAALAYADAMTGTGTVPDNIFAQVQAHFSSDQIVELTETIAWENCSARFNRALHVSSSGLYAGGALSWPRQADW